MSVAVDEVILFNITYDKALSDMVYMFALDVESHIGVNHTLIVNEVATNLRRFRAKNGGMLPRHQAQMIVDTVLEKYSQRVSKAMQNDCYLMTQGMYVIYIAPGEYMLTSDKEQASAFPNTRSAEQIMRELWIDGKIVGQ